MRSSNGVGFRALILCTRRKKEKPRCKHLYRPVPRLATGSVPNRAANRMAGRSVLDVEGFGAGRLAVLVERDFFDPGLRLAQEHVAMAPQRLSPLIDEDRSFELDIALLKAFDDRLELLERLLEAHGLDVGVVSQVGHGPALAPSRPANQEARLKRRLPSASRHEWRSSLPMH